MIDYVENFIYGHIAGGTATLVSHPFFNMKNHLQNGLVLGKEHYRNLKWLYGGMSRAIVGYGLEKMIVFGVYNSLKKHDYNSTFSGMIAGMFASVSITPAEQLTIDKQLNVRNFTLRHLYQGWVPTLFRESLGFAIHFTVYDYLTKKYNEEKSRTKTALCGAGAIIAGWGTITPIDRIKTKIQSGTFDYKTYDYRSSFSGFRFAIMRAVPFHVTCFLIMEELNMNRMNIRQKLNIS